MITIVPAAGKSSRYFGKKPKWLRTLPNGRLMIEMAIDGLIEISDRTLLIISRSIEDEFQVTHLLDQIFGKNLEVIVLESSTGSAVETVVEGLIKAKVSLSAKLLIKDSDNIVRFSIPEFNSHFSVGCNISNFSINNVGAKSFFKLSENLDILDFVEKQVVSKFVSVGTHGFILVSAFLDYATILLNGTTHGIKELYISNVVALMIYDNVRVRYIEALDYLDLGTQQEWEALRRSQATYFIDYDGTLVKNAGKYGRNRWDAVDVGLMSNIAVVKRIFDGGAQIVITTSRPEEYRDKIQQYLNSHGIVPYMIVTGLNHSQRYLINDYAETNVYPSAVAINVPRDGDLKDFFVV